MMKPETMPTVDARDDAAEQARELATHHGGKLPFDEQFRKARLRREMFGDDGSALEVGRYTIIEQIGAGAMGTVYRARDRSLDRDVAVKVLHRSGEAHRGRMQVEAKALARLSHPNVVTVHEVGSHEGHLFVAMEYVQGQTLTDWLKEKQDGDSILRVFGQAAAGLEAAHAAGIVHRDFKPDNVLVGDDGRVRVLDFGLARTSEASLVDEVEDPDRPIDTASPSLTRTGMLAGTPGYMAPEQFLGSQVDGRADQFAFCVALHEALWGSRPFVGETLAELATKVIHGEATMFPGARPPGLSPERGLLVERALTRGLAVEAEERFALMSDLVAALSARPVTRSPKMVAGAAAAVLVLLGLTGLAMRSYVATDEPSRPASPAVAARAPAPAKAPEDCPAGTTIEDGACVDLPITQDVAQCQPNNPASDDGWRTTTCKLPRWVAVRFLGNAEFRNHMGRVVPVEEDGKTVGHKIFFNNVPNSLYTALGFKAGDTLRGMPDVAEIETFRAQLDSTSAPTQFVVTFDRKGTSATKTIVLIDGQSLTGSNP